LPALARTDTLALQLVLAPRSGPFMGILSTLSAAHWTAGLIALAALAAIGYLTLFRTRARPERALAAARQRLERGDWSGALDALRRLRTADSAPPAPWHDERRLLEADCLVAASDAALRERRFADALARYREAAAALGLSEEEAARRIVEAMLAEVRRLSLAEPKSPILNELTAHVLERQPACAEALFWRGLHALRANDTKSAIADLTAAHAAANGLQVDAALYLGGVWLRDGQPRDALRVLAEANKLAPQCPLVGWQLGAALLAAGGDALLAVRALQKATGPDGAVRFLAEPARLWIETLPPDSWVRNVVRRAGPHKTQFTCPLGFDRLKAVLAAARLSLAEALVLCNRSAEAVPIFTELLRTEDTLAIRRGLGLALAGLDRFDEALPHLQKATALETPPQPRTVGTLAVCLARASGDRIANIQRALALIAGQPIRADAIWARRAGAVFAAAQAVGIAIAPAHVAELAAILVSSEAADRTAAAVYDLLALRDLAAVPVEAAWLYVRAAERENVRFANDDVLFDRAFGDRTLMARYFDAREWDFPAAERLYLTRWAERNPGTFPSAPGPTYPARAESALLSDSRRLEGQRQLESAQSIARLALTLAPRSERAHDRLAELAFRRGAIAEAIDWLRKWESLHPADPLPVVRLALIQHARGQTLEARITLDRALERTRGPARAPIALAAARIALAAGHTDDALRLIDECLTFDSKNSVALSARAALLCSIGSPAESAKLTETLAILDAGDPWFHYLVAVSAYCGGMDELAANRGKLCAGFPETAAEGGHLLALLRARQGKATAATSLLQQVVNGPPGVTLDHARAMRGQLAWQAGDYAEALRAWQLLSPARLKAWHLDAVVPGAAFVAGLKALRAGHAEDAAKWLRAAARFGHVDPRLDALLAFASVQPGADNHRGHAVARLEQALEAAGPRPTLVQRLVRAYRQLGRRSDARRLLDRVRPPDAALLVESGLLHLADGQIIPAERAFADAVALEPSHGAAIGNLLLTRLSLGRMNDALAILPAAIEHAPTPPLRRLFTLLERLTTASRQSGEDWAESDDDALVQFLRALGRLDAVEPLADALSQIRRQSAAVRRLQAELAPLRAKQMLDRGDAAGVLRKFGPLAADAPPVLRNLLGVAAALRQDFAGALRHFHAARPATGVDARLEQNLAIVRGWGGKTDRAAGHWQRFLGAHRDQAPAPPNIPNYHRRIENHVERLLQQASVSASVEH
jgi:tetratricopeptide (TPR) repeat protein